MKGRQTIECKGEREKREGSKGRRGGELSERWRKMMTNGCVQKREEERNRGGGGGRREKMVKREI